MKVLWSFAKSDIVTEQQKLEARDITAMARFPKFRSYSEPKSMLKRLMFREALPIGT